MNLDLQGRTALVVGGSKGIGFAVARRLAFEDAAVTLLARNEAALASASERIWRDTGNNVRTVCADVTTPETIIGAAELAAGSNGSLDALITNCPGPPAGPVLEQSDERWRGAFDHVVMSAIWMIRAARPLLQKAEAPAIVCINSYIFREPQVNRGLSNVPRAGLAALAKTLAAELSGDRIRVNSVSPGPVWTERSKELLTYAATKAGTTVDQEKQKLIDSRLLVNRYGAPDDVANLVAFLVSPLAGFITGANIPVDGGFIRSLP